MNRFVRNVLDLAAALLRCAWRFAPPPADAIETNWKTTSGGNFSNASNWDNGVPDSTKVADFGLGAVSYTVTYNGAPISFPPPQYQANQLIVSGTNNVTFARGSFILPVAPTLTATNTDTTSTSPGLVVGDFSGDNATLNDSIFTSVTEGIVGFAQGSTGTLNVSGAGTNFSDLIIGYQGLGAVNISGSTHVTASDGCLIGYTGNAGNHGQLTVTGAGTTLSAPDITVGLGGPANSMTVSAVRR